jgi:hypothetical protein
MTINQPRQKATLTQLLPLITGEISQRVTNIDTIQNLRISMASTTTSTCIHMTALSTTFLSAITTAIIL